MKFMHALVLAATMLSGCATTVVHAPSAASDNYICQSNIADDEQELRGEIKFAPDWRPLEYWFYWSTYDDRAVEVSRIWPRINERPTSAAPSKLSVFLGPELEARAKRIDVVRNGSETLTIGRVGKFSSFETDWPEFDAFARGAKTVEFRIFDRRGRRLADRWFKLQWLDSSSDLLERAVPEVEGLGLVNSPRCDREGSVIVT